jgi:hypothetical protein
MKTASDGPRRAPPGQLPSWAVATCLAVATVYAGLAVLSPWQLLSWALAVASLWLIFFVGFTFLRASLGVHDSPRLAAPAP